MSLDIAVLLFTSEWRDTILRSLAGVFGGRETAGEIPGAAREHGHPGRKTPRTGPVRVHDGCAAGTPRCRPRRADRCAHAGGPARRLLPKCAPAGQTRHG